MTPTQKIFATLAVLGLVLMAGAVGGLSVMKNTPSPTPSPSSEGGENLGGGIYQALQFHFGNGLFAGLSKQLKIDENGNIYGGTPRCRIERGSDFCSIQNTTGSDLLMRANMFVGGHPTTTAAQLSVATSSAPLTGQWRDNYATTSYTLAPLKWLLATTSIGGLSGNRAFSGTSSPNLHGGNGYFLLRKNEYAHCVVMVPHSLYASSESGGFFEKATSTKLGFQTDCYLEPMASSTPS